MKTLAFLILLIARMASLDQQYTDHLINELMLIINTHTIDTPSLLRKVIVDQKFKVNKNTKSNKKISIKDKLTVYKKAHFKGPVVIDGDISMSGSLSVTN